MLFSMRTKNPIAKQLEKIKNSSETCPLAVRTVPLETVEVDLTVEQWGKLVEVVKLRKLELLTSSEESKGLYKDVLLAEASILSEIASQIESEILL